MLHTLKVRPEYFQALKDGRKKAELRKDDRGFREGDKLYLREWEEKSGYTGRFLFADITHILKDLNEYGLMDGYCILSVNITNMEG